MTDLSERIAQLAREIYGECDAAEFPVDFIQEKILSLAASERELGVAAGLEKAAEHWPIGELATLTDFRCSCGALIRSESSQTEKIAAWQRHIRSLPGGDWQERHDAETRSKLLSDLTHDNDVASALAERDVDIERRARLDEHKQTCGVCWTYYSYDKPTFTPCVRARELATQPAPAKEDA